MSPGSAADQQMSPGATFERVYRELKRMLAEGDLPPGTPIEPAIIGRQIASSITPVRDALHRLAGERLVEAPNHNGFRVPMPTEAALRDLYGWNAQLLGLAVRRLKPAGNAVARCHLPEEDRQAIKTAVLFTAIARLSDSDEHERAVGQLNERLAPYRRVETMLFDDLDEELDDLIRCGVDGQARSLAKLLDRYHRRRLRAVPALLDVLLHDRPAAWS